MSQYGIKLLNYLKLKEVKMGVLTDSRSVHQRNKLKSLLFISYFYKIIISEEFGSEKPNIKNYQYFEDVFGQGEYFYVGANINKDFIIPNQLNWITICTVRQ